MAVRRADVLAWCWPEARIRLLAEAIKLASDAQQ
jgi:hypothetical protein